MKFAEKMRSLSGGLPPPVAAGLKAGLSFAAGLAAALVLYYVLYRVGLPSKPFIYVSF